MLVGVTIEVTGRRRWFGLLLATTLALAACRDERPAEPVTTIARPLTVGTTELAIAPPSQSSGGSTTTSSPRVACNAGGRCLAAWVQTYGTTNYVFARRIDQNGLVDAQVIVLGTITVTAPQSASVAAAARDAGDFMVAWWSTTNGGISLARVDATTGAVLDSPPKQIADTVQSLNRILIVNDSYAVVYGSTGAAAESIFRAARVQGGVVVDAPGISLGPSSAATRMFSTFAVGPGQQIAVVSTTGLRRVDLATGTILDATPVAYNQYAVGDGFDEAGVAYDGANYIVIWAFGGRTYAIRVRASDGAILDPHDDVNQVTGAHVIATSSIPLDIATAVFDGTYVILFASTSRAAQLTATRVNTSATPSRARRTRPRTKPPSGTSVERAPSTSPIAPASESWRGPSLPSA